MAEPEFTNPEAVFEGLRGLVQDTELLAEAIVDTITESVLLLDGNLTVHLANRSFYRTFQVTKEQTIDLRVYDIGNGQWNIPELRRLLERILPENNSFHGFEVDHEFPAIGRKVMVLNARKLRRRPEQRELILLAIEDVTALRETERRNASIATIFRSSGEALISLSPDGIIEMWNPAAERLFGYRAEEIVGSSIFKITDVEFHAEQQELIARVRAGGSVSQETIRTAKDRRRVPILLNTAPISDAKGRVIGISAALTDITERRQIEQALRRRDEHLTALIHEKGNLIKEIHHRVKNNLQLIVSLLSIHAGYSEDPHVVSALTEAGNRMRTIAAIHQQLYASDNLSELQFGAYLRRLMTQIVDLYGRPGITVDIRVEEIPLEFNMAVPLGLIANELISNAFKHAFPEDRGGHITVSLARQPSSARGAELDTRVFLRVEDDGIGFPTGYDMGTASTMGIRIVRLLAEQITTDVQVETVTGVTWTITFVTGSVHQTAPKGTSDTDSHSDR